MTQIQSLTEKKNFTFSSNFTTNEQVTFSYHFSIYHDLFWVYRRNSFDMAQSYVLGLMRCEKNHTNMERMSEFDTHNDYHRYYHFLSESPWDAFQVNRITAQEASRVLHAQKLQTGLPTGLIIDESSHLKKGKESVGVSRQYAGQIGKVDNCQVAVYASLCNGVHNTLLSNRLFLPEQWTSDKKRMEKAGIPSEYQSHKTKPELALEIIDEAIKNGVEFDWIGGDGLYGHHSELTRSLDQRGLFYVLDVHKNEHIYLQEPVLSLPPKKGTKGRLPSQLKADIAPVSLETYRAGLKASDWTEVKVRKTTKGFKKVKVHIGKVWHWNGKESQACPRILVMSVDSKDKRVKYSFSNGQADEYTPKEYAWYQCSRYWVERSFDDAKNELGLSGYQVRSWRAWHHHVALVMAAALYLMKRRINKMDEYPLLSLRDARILTIAHLFGNEQTIRLVYRNMINRHRVRKRDIDRHFRKDMDQEKIE